MAEDKPTQSLTTHPTRSPPLELNRPRDGMLARLKRVVGTLVGVSATVFSALVILGAVINRSGDSLATTIVGCAIFTGFGVAGAVLVRRMLRQQANSEAAPALAEAIRQRLLATASAHQGRLTVAELAAALTIAPEPAERVLEQAAQSGVARLLFSPEGVPVYEFPGLLAAKAEAKEPWQL